MLPKCLQRRPGAVELSLDRGAVADNAPPRALPVTGVCREACSSRLRELSAAVELDGARPMVNRLAHGNWPAEIRDGAPMRHERPRVMRYSSFTSTPWRQQEEWGGRFCGPHAPRTIRKRGSRGEQSGSFRGHDLSESRGLLGPHTFELFSDRVGNIELFRNVRERALPHLIGPPSTNPAAHLRF